MALNGIREIKIDAVTAVVRACGRGLAGLSDRGLLHVLGAVRGMVRDEAARSGIDELAGVIKDGPPGTVTIRRMLRESRREELRDFVSENFFFREMDPEDLWD